MRRSGPHASRILAVERWHAVAWAAIAVALAARVGWAAWVAHAHPAAVVSPDTPDYLGPARALVEAGRFTMSPADDTPMFLRTPGYPAFLGAILWMTNSEWAISPIQAALSGLAVIGVVLIGRRMIGMTAGLVAGVIVALDPLQFALSGTVLTEALATLLLVGAVAAGVAVFACPPDRVQLRYAFVLGTSIALATIVRPTTYYFPVVVVVLLAIRFWRLPRRTMLALMVAFVLPVVLVVGGWMARNQDAVGSWQISGSQALTVYCWHAAEVEANANDIGMREARRRLECPSGGGLDITADCPSWWACDVEQPAADGASWDEMNRRGIEILMRHPVESAEMYLRGLAREIAAPGAETVARFLDVRSSPALGAVLLVWNAMLWALALVGAVVGMRSRHRLFWGFVISIVVYVMLVSAGANAAARFRTPIVPLLALLAALGVHSIVQRLRERSSPTETLPEPTTETMG